MARFSSAGRWALLLGGLVYTVAILEVDARASRGLQDALGVVTFAALLASAQLSSRRERFEMWLCLAYSTAIELFATQVWGLYHYRFGNVPLYVPPGHGLIYLFAAHVTRTPLVERHRALLARLTLGVATLWAALGVAFARDLHGAIYIPGFAWMLLRTKEAPAFAATFVIASIIEVLGVSLGTWHWSRVVPWLGLTSSDPPSAVAAGYCWFGFVGLKLAALALRKRGGAPRTTGAPLRESVGVPAS